MTKFDWVVVGGGIAGIAIAEVLTREGHTVALVEKQPQLAAATSKEFHEWIHTGSLYTLIPDRLLTMKYMLGAIDDLLDYYGSFERMNLVPTECGLDIGKPGWFTSDHMQFRYRIRHLNPVWSLITARSMYLIQQIAKHDWLRRRAGILDEFKIDRLQGISANLKRIWRHRDEFIAVDTSDMTSNSRLMLRDLVATAMNNGLTILLGDQVEAIRDHGTEKLVVTGRERLRCRGVILCPGGNTSDFTNVKVTTTYAPMAVVAGLHDFTRSFVELDYHVERCANLVVKGNGLGLVGGISLKHRGDCDSYLDYIIDRHREFQPDLRVLGRYVGLKNEITFPKQDRNYLFHIVQCDTNVWTAIPGKFTLAFSMAVELYRRIYHKNPRKHFHACADTGQATALVADTRWQELAGRADTQMRPASIDAALRLPAARDRTAVEGARRQTG